MSDHLARFVELEKERRQIEDRLEEIKQETNYLQGLILDEWADRGQQNANLAGMTVYIAHDFYCNKRPEYDQGEVCRRLADEGLGRLVSPAYSAASLKAWVKEQLSLGADVPERLKEVLNYDEVPRLRARLSR